MELLHKVKAELEKKGYDFSSEFWYDGAMLTLLHDIVYATEKVLSGQERAETPQPKKTPTTYRECLEALPDGYRELALKNAEEQNWWNKREGGYCENLDVAVFVCFEWNKTKQGFYFWQSVYDHYLHETTLPELPNNE